VNALTLFYARGRSAELRRTLDWVIEVLRNRAYMGGTRYYETPECFLYFVSRLLCRTGDQELHLTLKPLLKERVHERVGADGDSITLAMRILTCDLVGIRDEVDLRALRSLQCIDGGWDVGYMFKYGSSGIRIGNRGLSTALAIKAIECMSTPTLTLPFYPTSSESSPEPVGPSPPKRRYSNALRNSFNRFWNSGRKAAQI
jgi:hypothetical protein